MVVLEELYFWGGSRKKSINLTTGFSHLCEEHEPSRSYAKSDQLNDLTLLIYLASYK